MVLAGCARGSAACPSQSRIRRPQHPGFWRSVAEGVAAAAKSDEIWPVLLLNFGVGIFYVGPFMAVLPLVVRDNYHGGSADLAYVNLASGRAPRQPCLRGAWAPPQSPRPPDRWRDHGGCC